MDEKRIPRLLKFAVNRDMIYKALTDAKFRKQLEEDPNSALGKKKLSTRNLEEIRKVLEIVGQIDVKIGTLADAILCASVPV